jgi:hypothetical protein
MDEVRSESVEEGDVVGTKEFEPYGTSGWLIS